MLLKNSKEWELVGIASFKKGNSTSQSGGGYTLIAPSLEFIQTHIQNESIYPTMPICSCQCPHGFNSGYAFSAIHTVDRCVDACMAVISNPCIDSNTYACLGPNCTHSDLYNASIIPSTEDHQPSLGMSVYFEN